MTQLGIFFSFLAFLFWGVGDFLIQSTSRMYGVLKTMFYIGIGGLIILFPFAYKDLHLLNSEPRALLLLVVITIVGFFTGMANFQAFKIGKMSVIAPILGLELPITVGLDTFVRGEDLSSPQVIFIGIAFVGLLLLAITEKFSIASKSGLEKGIGLALLGGTGLALCNYLIGVISQDYSPALSIWFTHGAIGVISLLILIFLRKTNFIQELRVGFRLLGGLIVLDNAAWIVYAYATVYVPISIATTISESYIALASVLGIYINKEKLKLHQYVGAAIAIVGIITLAAVS